MEFLVNNIRPLVFALSSGLFFFLESASPFKKQDEKRLRHIGRNLLIAVLNAVLYGVLFGTAVTFITSTTSSHHIGLFPWLSLPTAWEIFFTVIALDGVIYAWHVLAHRTPLIWKFHLVHHTDTVLDFTSGTRFHFGEMIGLMLFHLPFYFILGVSIDGLLVNQLLMIFFTQLAHANYRIPKSLDGILRTVFITSNLHQVHHSNLSKETNSNYGTIFSFWDRLFQTYDHRRDIENITTGIKGYPKGMQLMDLLKMPFKPSKQKQ
jgi:sterol desaturase/sphingolipid hydroxylase (fatty acid hydroxylase superfamily)